MSTLAAVLHEAEQHGVRFRLESGRIRFVNDETPAEEHMAALWRQRDELHRVLGQRAAAEGRCHGCGNDREPAAATTRAAGSAAPACSPRGSGGPWHHARRCPPPRTALLGRCRSCHHTASVGLDGLCGACMSSEATP